MRQFLTEIQTSARQHAQDLAHPYIRSEHLLLALLKQDESLLQVGYDALLRRIQQLPVPACGAEHKLTLAQAAKRAIEKAEQLASQEIITGQQLAEIILNESPMLRRILAELEADHVT